MAVVVVSRNLYLGDERRLFCCSLRLWWPVTSHTLVNAWFMAFSDEELGQLFVASCSCFSPQSWQHVWLLSLCHLAQPQSCLHRLIVCFVQKNIFYGLLLLLPWYCVDCITTIITGFAVQDRLSHKQSLFIIWLANSFRHCSKFIFLLYKMSCCMSVNSFPSFIWSGYNRISV